jgi:2-amino-4-hydroxy-6-hydroxymethyldihydropteridine diphosphokinase
MCHLRGSAQPTRLFSEQNSGSAEILAYSPAFVPVYIGLGSNVGDRKANLVRAMSSLTSEPSLRLLAHSSLYSTEPVGGPPGQPEFLNAVALFEYRSAPGAPAATHSEEAARYVLRLCMEIERQAGRDRRHEQRWGPRTLDLDLIAFGMLQSEDADLYVPHPRLYDRLFVLAPLLEIGVHQTAAIDLLLAQQRRRWLESQGEQRISVLEKPAWFSPEVP